MVRVNASFRFCANRRRDTVGQFEHCTVSPQDLYGCPCVCVRACENPPLYYCHDADILVCIFRPSILLRSPLCSREWSPRSSTRFESAHPDTSPLFELSMARTERRTDTRREKRIVSRQWKPRAVLHVDEARIGSSRVFFSAGRLSVSRLTRREERKRILMAAMK